MSQRADLRLEQLEPRRLLAVDVLANLDTADASRFVPRDLAGFQDSVYFRLADGDKETEVWRIDGTAASTQLLEEIGVRQSGSGGHELVDHDGWLYFAANHGFGGQELWRTKGTRATTQRVADIWPGNGNGAPTELTSFNGLLYFFAHDGESGRELYRSDGTTVGTKRVADSVVGPNGSAGEDLIVVGEQMFFKNENMRAEAQGLWVSDGTADGTKQVPIPGVVSTDIHNFYAFGDRLVFASAGKLWVTDGTEAGSQPITPTGDALGVSNTSIQSIDTTLYVTDELGLHEISDSLSASRTVSGFADRATVSNGKVYFWTNEGFFVMSPGGEPTALDTFNPKFGTKMGPTAPVPGGILYTVNRTLERYEIWVTDGTAQGTELLERVIDHGGEPLADFKLIGDRVYFTATNGNSHKSIWAIPAPKIDEPPGFRGDINGDDLVNTLDIDAFYAKLRSNATDHVLDLNGDFNVSSADADYLITEILDTRRGDLNLDGKVDFTDFLLLSGSFGKENATWAEGDSNGDGRVTFADFLSLSANFGSDSRTEVESALVRAKQAYKRMHEEKLSQGQAFEVGTLWNIRKLADISGDQEYQQWFEQMLPLSNSRSLALVDPRAPKLQLPENGEVGSGLLAFANYVAAAYSEPAEVAESIVTEFAELPAQRYVLTHQVLAIEWMKERGLLQSASIEKKKQELLDRIAIELENSVEFDDLYAERAVVTLLYKDKVGSTMDRHVRHILDSQLEAGDWGSFPSTVEFQGESKAVTSQPDHTLSLALLALTAHELRNAGVEAIPASTI